jgi:hypothetical protein
MKSSYFAALLGSAAVLLAVPAPAAALTINASYFGTFSAGELSVLSSAVDFYEANFADPFTATIGFYSMNSGLGESSSYYVNMNYAAFRTALNNDNTTANDTTALANVPATSTNPLTGTSSINVKTANARALGFNVTGGSFSGNCTLGAADGCIGLNVALIASAPYSLAAVAMHEIDEVLGLGSILPAEGDPFVEDLFRWSATGVRSFTTSCTTAAYFSIDGGATNLAGLNCGNAGDYGDWSSSAVPQVQDAFGTPGSTPTLNSASPEVIALDVIGYNLVPEPASTLALASGLFGLAAIRRRRPA